MDCNISNRCALDGMLDLFNASALGAKSVLQPIAQHLLSQRAVNTMPCKVRHSGLSAKEPKNT
eukprot:1910607-Amphidinium_carterae.1